jgi:hypothetical protein
MEVIRSPYFVEPAIFSESTKLGKLAWWIGFRLSIVSNPYFHPNRDGMKKEAFLSLSSYLLCLF